MNEELKQTIQQICIKYPVIKKHIDNDAESQTQYNISTQSTSITITVTEQMASIQAHLNISLEIWNNEKLCYFSSTNIPYHNLISNIGLSAINKDLLDIYRTFSSKHRTQEKQKHNQIPHFATKILRKEFGIKSR